ncbi:hypothetical protein TNIN_147421 [Trichonephila inaurata madagascariensis]|uniref:Uncharacterized protein n=1 Tax=Trichonephila inaurata madagascariensis TaxID=2747483 RepID=A0A8X6YQX1_9ARAC|nr:hypothetical protein TNIN_147421 [Trichonephila inaurata madagascariensis]
MCKICEYIDGFILLIGLPSAKLFFIIWTIIILTIVQFFCSQYDLLYFFILAFIVFEGMAYRYLSKVGRLLSLIVAVFNFLRLKILRNFLFPLREPRQIQLSAIEFFFMLKNSLDTQTLIESYMNKTILRS